MTRTNSPRLNLDRLDTKDLPSTVGTPDFAGVVRSGHDWFVAHSQTTANAAQVRTYGQTGDRYLSGDWNGDGYADMIAVRPEGLYLKWVIDTDGDRYADTFDIYGLVGDTPFVGDWDGDGDSDPGIARKNAASGGLDWYLDTSKQNYANPAPRQLGLMNDTPVVGDWDGNGRTDVGAVRPDPTNGMLQWFLDTNGDIWGDIVRHYGLLSSNDRPITGNWNTDAKTEIGITRNLADNTKWWYLDTNGDVFADMTQRFGFASDIPVVGAWTKMRTAEMTVVGITDGQSTAQNFGTAMEGTTGPTKTITVRNDGNGRLMFSGMTLPQGYSIVEGLAGWLEAGQSDSFTVRLNTNKPGTYNGQLSIANSDFDENPYNFPLAGVVTPKPAPEITVLNLVNGQSTPVDFGTIIAGNTAATRTFTVRNDGNAPLTMGMLTLPTGFTLTEGLLGSLNPGASDTFTVQMTGTTGTYQGMVQLVSNDQDENPFRFPIMGSVEAASPELQITVDSKQLNGTSGTVNFGARTLANLTTIVLTLENKGNAPLTLNWSSLPASFNYTGLVPTLAAGMTTQVTLRMKSIVDNVGNYKTGTLQLLTNDADESNISLFLRGKVLANPVQGGGSPTGGSTHVVYGSDTWEIVPPSGSVPFGTAYVLRSTSGTITPLSVSVTTVKFVGNATVINWTTLYVIGGNVLNYGSDPLGLL